MPWVMLGAGLLACGGLVVAWGYRRGSWSGIGRVALLVACFVLLGAGWQGVHQDRIARSLLLRSGGRAIRVEGTLASDPQGQALGWNATLRIGRAFIRDPFAGGRMAVLRLRETLWLDGRGPTPRASAGERVEVTGLVSLPRGEFGSYLRHRGFSGAISADRFEALGPPSGPVMRAANAVRSALRRSARRVLPTRHAGLLMGLALGDTSELDPNVEEDFRATGLSHLTAVSGENVAMFLAPVLALAMLLRLGPRSRFLVGLGAIAFFVLLTRAEPSVLRAAIMSGLAMLGIFLGRPRSPPAILGGAVLLLLAIDPTLVYAIGFQLSVAATAGMALLSEPIAGRLTVLPRWLALAAATTIGAQAGVTPLLLYHFGVVPTVTVLANLLAFPAVGLGMILGLIAAAFGLAVPGLGRFVGWLAGVPLAYLEGVADRLARSPFPSVTSGTGRWTTLLVGSAAVALGTWWLRSGRRLSRRMVLAALLVLPVFLWVGAVRAGPPSALTITFFDVGQGDSALIRSPRGAVILIDGGPDPELVATKLASLGVRRIDLIVATHPHADHVAGLPAVLARFPASMVIDPGCSGPSPYYQAFLRSVRASGVPIRHPPFASVLHVGDVIIQVLGPERCFIGTNSDPNNDSMV